MENAEIDEVEKSNRLEEIAYAIQCELESIQSKISDMLDNKPEDEKQSFSQALSMGKLYIMMSDRIRMFNALNSLDVSAELEEKLYDKLQLYIKENSDSSDTDSVLDMLCCEINLEDETADYIEKSLEQFIEKL